MEDILGEVRDHTQKLKVHCVADIFQLFIICFKQQNFAPIYVLFVTWLLLASLGHLVSSDQAHHGNRLREHSQVSN